MRSLYTVSATLQRISVRLRIVVNNTYTLLKNFAALMEMISNVVYKETRRSGGFKLAPLRPYCVIGFQTADSCHHSMNTMPPNSVGIFRFHLQNYAEWKVLVFIIRNNFFKNCSAYTLSIIDGGGFFFLCDVMLHRWLFRSQRFEATYCIFRFRNARFDL